jgi:hypothetical protein
VGIKFTNNAEGTLTAGIDDSATVDLTLTAGDGLLFPTIVLASGDYFYATLVDSAGNREIIQVTEHQSGTDVFQTIVRGEDDTSGIAFAIGDKVQLRLPKVILEEFQTDITTNASDLTDYETSNDIAVAALESYNSDSAVLAAPTGITLYIYNPAGEIPTGWSAKSGPADCLLAIAGGSDAYNVAGENVVGSWTPTGHVHTGPSHIHTMPTHTHSGPSHSHSGAHHYHLIPNTHSHVWLLSGGQLSYNSAGNQINIVSPSADQAGIPAHISSGDGHPYTGGHMYTSKTGGGNTDWETSANTGSGGTGNTGAKDPGDTNASGTANTGSSKEPSTDRPSAAVGLLIERD